MSNPVPSKLCSMCSAFSKVLFAIKAKLKHVPARFVGQRAFRGVITVQTNSSFSPRCANINHQFVPQNKQTVCFLSRKTMLERG